MDAEKRMGMSVSVQNSKGQWVPAIPLPYFLPFHRYRCGMKCRETFWTTAGYRGHYALVHILGLDDD
jgi:hypothetical protein